MDIPQLLTNLGSGVIGVLLTLVWQNSRERRAEKEQLAAIEARRRGVLFLLGRELGNLWVDSLMAGTDVGATRALSTAAWDQLRATLPGLVDDALLSDLCVAYDLAYYLKSMLSLPEQGIASAAPLVSAGARLRDWLDPLLPQLGSGHPKHSMGDRIVEIQAIVTKKLQEDAQKVEGRA